MTIKYNVPGIKKQNLAKEIAKWLCVEMRYLGAPEFAYKIGACRLDFDGTLTINTEPYSIVTKALLAHLESKGYRRIN